MIRNTSSSWSSFLISGLPFPSTSSLGRIDTHDHRAETSCRASSPVAAFRDRRSGLPRHRDGVGEPWKTCLYGRLASTLLPESSSGDTPLSCCYFRPSAPAADHDSELPPARWGASTLLSPPFRSSLTSEPQRWDYDESKCSFAGHRSNLQRPLALR